MSLNWSHFVASLLAFACSLGCLLLMLKTRVGLPDDVPNERSMHTETVPRGGGVAFVLSTLLICGLSNPILFPGAEWISH